MGSQAISFDSPLQQATTVPIPGQVAPAGSTAPTPTSPNSGAPQGVTFDDAPTTQATTVSVPGPSQAQTPPQGNQTPTATLKAVPDDTLTEKVKNWAGNVAGDIKYGTSVTGIGHVLKSLGAHGVYSGNPEAVGDFMASLPLGLLKATKGGAELGQDGQRWQGVKDVAVGALDASTIPGGFIAPEAGELAGTGFEAGVTRAADAASSAGKGLKAPFSKAALQPALHSGIRQILGKVAEDAGVAPANAESIRDVAANLSDAIRAKSSAIYQQLDDATGGRFQRFDDALKNINQGLRDAVGVDPDREAVLTQRKAEIEEAQRQALDDARKAGVDPALITKAVQSWRQQSALTDLSASLRQSVTGMRPELASGAKASPETVNTKQLFTKVNRLNDKGRLADAIGADNAAALLQHVDSAFLQAQKIANRNKYVGAAVKSLGLGGLGYAAVQEAHSLLGGSQ